MANVYDKNELVTYCNYVLSELNLVCEITDTEYDELLRIVNDTEDPHGCVNTCIITFLSDKYRDILSIEMNDSFINLESDKPGELIFDFMSSDLVHHVKLKINTYIGIFTGEFISKRIDHHYGLVNKIFIYLNRQKMFHDKIAGHQPNTIRYRYVEPDQYVTSDVSSVPVYSTNES